MGLETTAFIVFSDNFQIRYRTRAIITRGLYIYYSIFEVHFFVFKEVFFRKFCPYLCLVFKSGFKLRAGYDGACTVHKSKLSTENLQFTTFWNMNDSFQFGIYTLHNHVLV
jgi:hypothetical protein